MKLNALMGAIVISTIGASVFAHNGATGMVMERMNGMTSMRDVMRDLAPMMQGEVAFDVRAVQTAGATLMAHSGENMSKLFPKEAIPAASYAKEEIWSDWDKFAALSEELRTYAMGLAIAAPNGLTAPAVGVTPSTEGAAIDHSTMQMDPPKEMLTLEQLMGVSPRGSVTSSTPMQMDEVAPAIDFALLAADDVFEKVSQTCSSCHAQFRRGN